LKQTDVSKVRAESIIRAMNKEGQGTELLGFLALKRFESMNEA
jgi:hypothetical protein